MSQSQKRVSEREVPEVNPNKRFFPDFPLCNDTATHTSYSYRNKKDVGEKGVALVEAVLAIHGVIDLTISKNELRVVKQPAHTWEEVTPLIHNAFRHVYGDDIKFIGENKAILAYRRLRVAMNVAK